MGDFVESSITKTAVRKLTAPIADITAFCGLEFARLVKFRPADAGLKHLAHWRERVAERPSAKL